MNKEEFIIEQMELSKEDIIANYWYTYQDNIERLGIEHQLNLKDKEIERLNNIINKIKRILHNSIEYNALTKLALIEESLQGDDKE